MEITKYNSDSGNRDLSSERSYNKDIPFVDILKKANVLYIKPDNRCCFVLAFGSGFKFLSLYGRNNLLFKVSS